LLASTKKQSSTHRGRLDIIADILNASFGGVKKTYLMYRCNLSFKQLKFYLALLLHKKLLQIVGDNKTSNPSLFKITGKGKKFLEAYKGLKCLMK
jgi:predicted transcriptional regulator